MSRMEGLSRTRSPFLDRGGLAAFFGKDDRPRVHADAAALRAIRDALLRAAERKHHRILAHHRQHDLRSGVDHYIAVYVCGYVHAECGHDGVGSSFPWQTDVGTFSGAEACLNWCEDLDSALLLAGHKCPALRLDVRFGGKGAGLRRARFSRKHPVPQLAGTEIALPDPMPDFFRDCPAASITWALLEALAREKELGYPYPASVTGSEAA